MFCSSWLLVNRPSSGPQHVPQVVPFAFLCRDVSPPGRSRDPPRLLLIVAFRLDRWPRKK
eukprot:8527272-Pyramimonas_sp.AAC.1